MRVRRVLVGALVAVAAVVGVAGMAGSQNGSDDYVLWNVTSGAGNQYFQFDADSSQRQPYTGTNPWTLASSPELMTVAASGGAPHFSGVRHGVKNIGEGQGGQDSISETEVLALGIGEDLAPRYQFDGITGLKLQSQSGAATARLKAFSGDGQVGERTFEIKKFETVTVDVNFGAPFDTVEFSAVSGRFGIFPATSGTRFLLTPAQVVAPGEAVESENDDGDTAVTTCLGEDGCDGKGGEVPIEQAFGEDSERKFLDVIFVGDGGTVTLQTVLTYILDPVPAQLPVSEIDFNPLDADETFEDVTLCDSLPANGPTAGPPTETEKPACLRSLVATGNGDGTMTVVETYELAGDPRVRFA